MNTFLYLGLIFAFGFLGGYLIEKIRLPKLIWYLILGILIGPSLLNVVDPTLLSISSYLRQIALIIILTRSGLSLDLKVLKKIGRPAILMCFLPAVFEIAGITIFGPLLLGVSITEALLLGSVLAAVSPAVVVPRMIKLQGEGYSSNHHVAELIMAGSSADDIFVIVLFYAFKGVVATNSFDGLSIAMIPISIISGIALGAIFAVLIILLFKYIKLPTVVKVIVVLGVSFLMVGIENLIKPYFSISSLLGIIVIGIALLKFLPNEAKEIKPAYNSLWNGFEILLFALVGCAVDIKYAFTKDGAIILGLLFIGLLFRTIGVIICVIKTEYSFKEKIYIAISYLPKATVQASIGAIALSEGLACGNLVLTAAVVAILISAPLGAILMDTLKKKLLTKPIENI